MQHNIEGKGIGFNDDQRWPLMGRRGSVNCMSCRRHTGRSGNFPTGRYEFVEHGSIIGLKNVLDSIIS